MVAVGTHPARAVAAACQVGLREALVLDQPQDVAEALEPVLRPSDVVLVKGSRSAGLDVAAAALTQAVPV